MSGHRIRFMQGAGHQIIGPKGVIHSTYDDRNEAEEALEKLRAAKPLKEHEHPYWEGKK